MGKSERLSFTKLLSGMLLFMAMVTVLYGVEPIFAEQDVYHFAHEDPLAKWLSGAEEKIKDWGSGIVGSAPMDTGE